ncbi:tautomerase family protein [Deinococcus peraridilitoris]|uniref:Tautomerase enzyme n=1 Tax=Deinococcus peraridilitoris (strain DSM 19664 / LMG 22246 / CIP 109416 / KR-200) TaxID=937777 RepID=K9ZWL5_DEIPD|nr:tautomerase family protein [Deinococcus peraridilitoris]AFZ65976.1 hypothetical protein Deipe_0376 [Deinococcus peraridilitoris DSM 19664]
MAPLQESGVHGRGPQLLLQTMLGCLMRVLKLPEKKRFHRSVLQNEADFICSDNRSEHDLIAELPMFGGRATEPGKRLMNELCRSLHAGVRLATSDLEITFFKTPRAHWGIRGVCADEHHLPYEVHV